MLLKNFAENPSVPDPKVWTLNKANGTIFRANVKNIAVERYFYDPPGEQGTEEALALLEDEAAKTLSKLLQNQTIRSLDQGERKVLAYFVATLDARTSAFREAQVDATKQLDKKLQDMADAMGKQYKSSAPSTEEEIREHHKQVMWAMTKSIVRILPHLSWSTLTTNRQNPFVISDHPLVKQNPVPPPAPWMGNLGWINEGLEVFLPLSTVVCLFISKPRNLTHLKQYELPPDLVNGINTLQTAYAQRFLFARGEQALKTLEVNMSADPGLRSARYMFEML